MHSDSLPGKSALRPCNWPLLLAGTAIAAWSLLAQFAAAAQPDPQPARKVIRIAPEQLSAAQRVPGIAALETALAQVASDAQGNVRLDQNTESALSKASSQLPAELTALTLQRARLLISKTFAGRTGEQLAELFERYCRYRQALRHMPQPTGADLDLAAEVAAFQVAKTLQVQYLGAHADELFGQQNALTQYMFELRRLEADPALSEPVRSERRQALQTQFERAARSRH